MMPSRRLLSAAVVALVAVAGLAATAAAQKVRTRAGLADCPADSATPILAPTTPLPTEAASAGITRFSFFAYGDTRGRHDGTRIQPDHELIMESMLATAKTLANTADAVRFSSAALFLR